MSNTRYRLGRMPGAVAALVAAVALVMAGCTGEGRASQRATSGSAASPAAQEAVPPAPVTIAGYYKQKLDWRPCSGGFQCARLLVPVDYRHPAGSRFSLPVVRLPAADPARRIGSIVLNPGGPGGSGVEYARQASKVLSAAVLARFEVVGFDPRGVGGSQPAIRCMTGPQLDRYLDTDDNPANSAELSTVIAESRFFAQACARADGPLLPYVGTAEAARDMDILRAALGDRKLTYLGKSYGTYLGTYYAQLFPRNVRALVLDGAIDPADTAIDQNIVQAQGFQVAFRSFAADCVKRPDCPLGSAATASSGDTSSGDAADSGGSGAAVDAAVARLQALLNRAGQTPLANDLGDGRPGNEALVTAGVLSALYSKAYWPLLRTGLQDAIAGDGTVLIELADALMERKANGTYSNLAESNMAINCVDRPWPRALSTWRAAALTAQRDAPQFGEAIMWGSLPCAYWQVRGARVPSMHAAGAPPILVVGTTRDPATPYHWAQALAADLSSGVLLGWNGDGHTAYKMGSSCVDTIVDRYLIDGGVPKSGTVCS
ncbi:MAG TPA: alpha/beta hydrolase [Streptosporangiaceae bacterium]|nr:alpha/beta hydrolase [Streptosporangiaceae bacterium]